MYNLVMFTLAMFFLLSLGCPPATYGDHCEEKCDCEDDVPCDALSGECICPVGKTGSKCEIGE